MRSTAKNVLRRVIDAAVLLGYFVIREPICRLFAVAVPLSMFISDSLLGDFELLPWGTLLFFGLTTSMYFSLVGPAVFVKFIQQKKGKDEL